MPPTAEFEATILASEWLQTHVLDRAATGLGQYDMILYDIYIYI
jgi:hypothetical protein